MDPCLYVCCRNMIAMIIETLPHFFENMAVFTRSTKSTNLVRPQFKEQVNLRGRPEAAFFNFVALRWTRGWTGIGFIHYEVKVGKIISQNFVHTKREKLTLKLTTKLVTVILTEPKFSVQPARKCLLFVIINLIYVFEVLYDDSSKCMKY